MPTRTQKDFSVTWRQVAAFRLARHRLLERAAAQDVVSVAGEMAGTQAQLPSAAQLSLWARTQDLQTEDVEKALSRRALVKAACMRQTLFLVPSRDLAIFVRGSARRAAKEIRWTLGKGVPARTVDAAIDATLNELDEPLTRSEIAEHVSKALGLQKQAFRGGGWGSRRELAAVPVGDLLFPVVDLLHLVASRGVVCYGPYRGNEPTFVRADAWIPKWKDVSVERAEDLLLRKYLQAFGPSTATDFSLWSGMTIREAREVWARAQSGLVTVNVEGWSAAILGEDLDLLAQARLKRSVIRLLPYFDTFLLGHKERDHLVPIEHRPSVYRAQGWIAPVVLADGRVVAVWEHAREGNLLRIKVSKIEPLSQSISAGIREEAERLSRFLGTSDIDIQI